MKTVVIIPTYNERRNILELIPLLISSVPSVNVMVVDDNSPDNTAGAVMDMQKKYPNLTLLKRPYKEGLGRAYVHAFKEVLKDPTIEALITMDADFSHDPKYVPAMLELLSNGHDLVIGSRYVKGGGTSGWELWRRVLSRGGGMYVRMITGMPVSDATGGFNAVRTQALRSLDLDRIDMSGYAFQIEIKYALHSRGARIRELPIHFANRKEGESKISNHIIAEGIIAPWKMRFKK